MDHHNEVKRFLKDLEIADSLDVTGAEISKKIAKSGRSKVSTIAYNVPVTFINDVEESKVSLEAGGLIIEIYDLDTTVKDNLSDDDMSIWDLRNLAILLAVLHNLK